MIELLLETGADVNAKAGFYDYAISAVIAHKDRKVARLLLRYGAKVEDDRDAREIIEI